MAILVGPIGIGVMSQLGGISAIVFSVIPLGTVGITKYLSQYFEDDRKEDIRALIKYVVVWNFPILLTAMILIVVFSENISKFLFNDAHNSYLVVIFGLSLFFGLLSSIVEIVLKSVRKVSLYVKYTIISALLTLLISIPAIYFLNLTGAVLTFGFTFCFSFLVGFLLLKKNNLIPIGAKMKKTEKKVKSDILKIGLASTIMLVIQQVTLIYIKSTIAAKFGLSEVGIYQSVFSISTNYFGLFFGIIGIYCIPKLSTLKENSETILEINRTLKIILMIYVPAIALCFVFRILVIKLLYSDSFLGASELFLFQLLGEFCKALSWIFGLWLIPNLKIRAWFIFDIITTLLFVAFFLILTNVYDVGIESATIAYFCSYLIISVVNFIYIRKSISFTFKLSNFKLLISSILAISVVFCVSSFDVFYGYLCVVPVLLLWTKAVLKKRDVHSLIAIFRKDQNLN